MNRHKRKRKPKAKAPQQQRQATWQGALPAHSIYGGSYLPPGHMTQVFVGRSQRQPEMQALFLYPRRQGKSMVGGVLRELQAQGRALRVIDYAAIEARVVAHYDTVVIDSITKMRDLHREKAAEMFGCDAKDVTPDQRAAAKAENFFDLYRGTDWPAITNQKEPIDE